MATHERSRYPFAAVAMNGCELPPLGKGELQLSLSAREFVHSHPELSGQEENTSAYLRDLLSKAGLGIHGIPSSPSFLAVLAGERPHTIGFRAELDALPISEQTGLPYSSTCEGIMHACGHDVHMGIAVGLGLALKRVPSSQRPTVVLAFESSEEVLPGGATAILESTAWGIHTPNVMLGLHSEPTMAVGELGVKSGAYMASGDEVYITVHGKGGHAALPHQLVDPVLTAAQTLVALQSVSARYAPPLVPTVLSFGHIDCGGAMNLIPDSVRLEGTFRTHDEQWRAEAKEHILRIATHTAASMGARAEVDIRKGYPSLYNNPDLAAQAQRILPSVPGVTQVHSLAYRLTCDDFAHFALAVPSVYFRLGVGLTGGLHTATFNPSPEAIRIGIQSMLSLVLNLRAE